MNHHVGHHDGLDSELLAAWESLPADKRDLIMMELARRRGLGQSIPEADRGEGLRASSAQEGLWFLEQADPGSVAYVMPASVRLHGRLDTRALASCLTGIVRRHEVLRTTFTSVDGRPYQVVGSPAPVPLPVTDLRALSGDDRAAAVRAWQLEEAGKPFDIAVEPGLRARLLVTGTNEHVLMLTMHHIVSDGWSLGVLLHELATLYQAFSREAPSPLPDLPIQYGDFAEWQLDRVARVLDEHLEYWRRYLAGAPVLEWPASQPGQKVPAPAGAFVPWRLEPELVTRVGLLAESARATPFMVLLAAFAVLLGRWSGQQDLLIGYPTAGRVHADLEPLIGYFVNTLPLRADLGGRPAFTDLLRRVREDCTTGSEHQEVPFDRIVRELHPDRQGGQVPLIPVMMALRNVPMPELRLSDDLTLEPLTYPTVSAKFDLCLDLVPDRAGGIDGRMEYRTSLFDAQTVQRMVDSFRVLLDGLISDPSARISAVPMMTRAEGDRLVAEFSGGSTRAHGTLHGLFETRADTAPEAPALLCGDLRLSYRQLEERANALAWRLRDRGTSPEDRIGVCLPPSAETVVALLGVLKAGAAYALLDPQCPADRLASTIAEAGIGLVITTTAVARSGAFETRSDLLCLDDTGATARRVSRPASSATERTLASVTFVPGPAGSPMAAMNEHASLVASVRGVRGVYALTPDDRMLAISPLGYDACVCEIFAALAAGAAVVMPAGTEIADPGQTLELLRRQGVTAWSSAPATLEALVGHASQDDGTPRVPLRAAGVGGDDMPPDLPARLAELIPGIRVFNLAGMAEAAHCSTSYPAPSYPVPRTSGSGSSVPWGRPLPGHRVYVLDDHLRPVPAGVPGELFIGGLGPGRGYLRQPSLTAGRFVADPYATEPGGRMYATGDRARFLPDGNLEYLGRFDRQLKIRGSRVETGEVEAVIATHPAVLEPVVVSYHEPGVGRVLVAYLTTRIDPAPRGADLHAFLAERLPEHMIPAKFMVLDELPRLASGELDRAGLPDPQGRPPTSGTPYAEPESPLERTLADLLADLLERERVGALDDFFDLGGHSLLATQAVSRIREMFRVNLTIPGFLTARTVRALAQELRDLGMRQGVDVDAIAELVEEISALSADEATQRLAE